MLLRADETTESELKVDTFFARDNHGDQLHVSVFRDDSTVICQCPVGVSVLGPRGALKGVMALTLEQATALTEFLDSHINGRAPISGSIECPFHEGDSRDPGQCRCDEPTVSTTTPKVLLINGESIPATHFAWDGCHKVYLIGCDADRESMDGYGWSAEAYHPIAELPQAWEDSCALRFISWADLDRPGPVPQFAEAAGPVTIEVRPDDPQHETHRGRSRYDWVDGQLTVTDLPAAPQVTA